MNQENTLIDGTAANKLPETVIIPVVQETLQVNKKTIETGKIHVTKKVTSEETEVNVPLTSEAYEINHVPVNQVVNTPPQAMRYEGETMIISVVKEILVVEKKYEIIEELHITKRTKERNEIQQITLLHEEVQVERTPVVNEGQGS